ncbi:MAG: zinc metalloprotease HtpX [Chloroflexi bacterium]|nr:zinc metalloprotease HtpX [Chloroflexota bacterium]
MRRSLYGRDTELSVRMFIVMFLLAALYLAFVFVLYQAGLGYSTIIVIAAILLAAQYYFSDKLVLLSLGAQVVDEHQAPELHAVVTRLSAMADLPKPRVAIIRTDVPNALATGRDPQHAVVAVTTGLMQRLDENELEGVLAHELTHIKNRDATVITLASFFATVAFFVMRSGFFLGMFGGGYGRRRDQNGGGLVLIYLASLIVWVISFFLIRALSRYREYAADRGSAIITGAPSTLASALMKISGQMARIPQRDLREVEGMNAFFIVPAAVGNSFTELLSTHPSLEHRLARLSRLQEQMEGLGPR